MSSCNNCSRLTLPLISKQYLCEVPVNPHAFLHGLSAVVKARLGFLRADISYTAVVVVFVGLYASNVKLTSTSVIGVLQKTRKLGTGSENKDVLFTTKDVR